jgi:hypothetical protein
VHARYAFALQNLFYVLFFTANNTEFGEKLQISECLEMYKGTVLSK